MHYENPVSPVLDSCLSDQTSEASLGQPDLIGSPSSISGIDDEDIYSGKYISLFVTERFEKKAITFNVAVSDFELDGRQTTPDGPDLGVSEFDSDSSIEYPDEVIASGCQQLGLSGFGPALFRVAQLSGVCVQDALLQRRDWPLNDDTKDKDFLVPRRVLHLTLIMAHSPRLWLFVL
jgi:hypothetical protein